MKKLLSASVLSFVGVLASGCAPTVVPANWQGHWAQEDKEQITVAPNGQSTTTYVPSNTKFILVKDDGLVTGISVENGVWNEAPIAQVDVEEGGDAKPVRFFPEGLPEEVRDFASHAHATASRDGATGRLVMRIDIAELKNRPEVRAKYGSQLDRMGDEILMGFQKLSDENAARVSRHETVQ